MNETRAVTSPPPTPARSRLRRFLLPGLFLVVYVAQCLWFIKTQSLTLDEPGHIAAGLAMWKYGRFVIQTDNPPLARKLMTAPLYLFTNVDVDNLQRDPGAPPLGMHPIHAWYVRLPIACLGIGLGLSIWWLAKHLFSESAANFALALFAFSPGLIAHFSLATTDGAGVLTFFLAAIAFACWVNRPAWRTALPLGVAAGLMLIAKFYALPLTMVVLALMCVEGLRRRNLNILKHPFAVALIGYFIVCVAYNFHVARFRFANGSMTAHFQHRETDWVARVPFGTTFTVYVPAGDYLDGLARVYRTNQSWHDSYLMGEIADGGFRSYHLVAILLKWPSIVLLLSMGGFLVVLRRKVPWTRGAWLASMLPVIFLALTLTARLQIGDRHVLPVYPFLLVLAAAVWHFFRASRRALSVLMLLAVLNAADTLRYAPDYLSYFTPLVRPEATWRYLADSNVDWGQGLIALKKYQDANPDETLYVRNFGGFDPSFYGIRSRSFSQDEHPRGTVVISANELANYLARNHAEHWLWQYPLKARLNHTLLVFKTD